MEIQSAQKHDELHELFMMAEKLSSSSVRDQIVIQLYQKTNELIKDGVQFTKTKHDQRTEKIDAILTSPIFGFPIMLVMLGVIFYLTIAGANVPSAMLADFFGWLEGYITLAFTALNAPDWLHGVLVLGLYRGTCWVISVMLPPMAIFFPTFHSLKIMDTCLVLLLTWIDCLKQLEHMESSL